MMWFGVFLLCFVMWFGVFLLCFVMWFGVFFMCFNCDVVWGAFFYVL